MGLDTNCSEDSHVAPKCNPPSTSPRTSLDFTNAQGSSNDWTQNDDIFSLGDYLVCTRHMLGRGSFGEVKLGFHRPTGKRVAVKIINKTLLTPEKRKEVDREVEILKKVSIHPSIVTLHDVAEDEQFVYMFFEYVSSDLLRFLKSRGRLDERTAFHIFSQLAEAIAYLHSNGIVHRDIKIEVPTRDLCLFLFHSNINFYVRVSRTYSSMKRRSRSRCATSASPRTTARRPGSRSGAAALTRWRQRSSSEFPTSAPGSTCGPSAPSCTLCSAPTSPSRRPSPRTC
jgi:serine/threonine protein kinase